MTQHHLRQIPILLLFSIFSSLASAQSFVGPQASAMGGAGRAAIAPGEGAFLNPATIPFITQYFGTAFFGQGSHPNSGDEQQIGALLTDGTPDRIFQGALGYVHSKFSPVSSGDSSASDIYVAASGFAWKNIAFGIDAHRFVYSSQGDFTQYNGGAGLMYAYSRSLFFGVVASDILKKDEAVPIDGRLIGKYGFGASYNFENRLQFRLDAVKPTEQNPENKTDVMTGFESQVMEYGSLRAGFRWNEAEGPERRVFTIGGGFKGPKLRADYGFEKDTNVAGGIRHSFDLWMSF